LDDGLFAINELVESLTMPVHMPRAIASFDESGKYTDTSGVFVFAGLAAYTQNLTEIHNAWLPLLQDASLSHMSMKDAMDFKGGFLPFRDREAERDNLLRSLARVIADRRDLVLLASPYETSSAREFNRLTVAQRKLMLGNPYYAAFEACVLGALEQLPRALIHVVCDIAEEYSETVLKAFHKMRKQNQTVKERCLGISFQDDTWYPPLQVADMLAYCERKKLLAETGEPIPSVIQDMLEILTIDSVQERSVRYRFHGESGGIGHGELS
jgi:hypothetical protein